MTSNDGKPTTPSAEELAVVAFLHARELYAEAALLAHGGGPEAEATAFAASEDWSLEELTAAKKKLEARDEERWRVVPDKLASKERAAAEAVLANAPEGTVALRDRLVAGRGCQDDPTSQAIATTPEPRHRIRRTRLHNLTRSDHRRQVPASGHRTTQQCQAEYLLPLIVPELIRAGELTVGVVPTNEPWVGVTNPADLEVARRRIAEVRRG